MFYSPVILTKKGALGKIWIAAHLQHKLSKAQVFSTDVVAACEQLQSPELSFALRLSSNLLLGIVRIYSRKAHYLFMDSRDALNKLQLAFQGSTVDLPPGTIVAPYSTITMEGIDDTLSRKRDENSKVSSKRSRYDWDRVSETSSNLDIDMLLDIDTDMAFTLSSSEFRWNETAQSLSRFRARPEDITLPPVEMDFIYQLPDTSVERWDDHELLHRENINMNATPLSMRGSLQSPEILRRESRENLSGRISLDRLDEAQGKEPHNTTHPDWNFSMEMDTESFIQTSSSPTNMGQPQETSLLPLNVTARDDSVLIQESSLPNIKKRKVGSSIFVMDRNSEISTKTLKRHLSDTKDLVYSCDPSAHQMPQDDANTWLHMILETSSELPCIPSVYSNTISNMLSYYSQGDLQLPQLRHAGDPVAASPSFLSPGRDSVAWSLQDNDWGDQITFEQESFQAPNAATGDESIQVPTEWNTSHISQVLLDSSNTMTMQNEQDKEFQWKQNTLTQTPMSISSRTIQTLHTIQQYGTSFHESESKITFTDFVHQASASNRSVSARRLAAQYFYELLVLKSIDSIQVQQDTSFGEIVISNYAQRELVL